MSFLRRWSPRPAPRLVPFAAPVPQAPANVQEPAAPVVGESTEVLVRLAVGTAGGEAWEPLSKKIEERLRERFGGGSRLPPGVEFGDLLGDLSIKVLTKLGEFEDRGQDAFWRWVQTIASNLERDYWRRHLRAKALGLTGPGEAADDDQPSRLAEVAQPGESPTSIVRLRELERAEAECVAQLAQPYRRIYELRRRMELSYAEISRQLDGQNQATLRCHYLRAREQVQAMLRERLDRFGRGRGL